MLQDTIEVDDFATRRGGARGVVGQKDSTLCHYLKYFVQNEICIQHDNFYSQAGTIVMAIKALSYFCDGHRYPNSTYKIIFVKRDIAIKILGYVSENVPKRSSALAVYASYIELSKRRSIEHLDPYERRQFLHDHTAQLTFDTDEDM